jgi:lysophospholipase L1-like esterase
MIALLIACTPVESVPESVSGETDMSAIRYLALGDSYTIGESVPSADRWPAQLARLLGAGGIQTDLTIIARTGWTVDELWQGVQANPPEGTYDLVTLLIGVNDQYRGYLIDAYREDFRFILRKAIEYAGGNPAKVIVLSIPDWGVTPFAATRDRELISQQIDQFNAINLEETKNAGVHYVDVTKISRMAMDHSDLITADRLHPSGKMYAMWVEKVLPVAKEILK